MTPDTDPQTAEQAVRDILTAAGHPALHDEGTGPDWHIVTPGWHVFTYNARVRVDWWSAGTLSQDPAAWAADSAALAELRPALEAAGLTVTAPDRSALEIVPAVDWAGRNFGELTPDERRDAAARAGAVLTAELAANVGAISAALDLCLGSGGAWATGSQTAEEIARLALAPAVCPQCGATAADLGGRADPKLLRTGWHGTVPDHAAPKISSDEAKPARRHYCIGCGQDTEHEREATLPPEYRCGDPDYEDRTKCGRCGDHYQCQECGAPWDVNRELCSAVVDFGKHGPGEE